MSDRINVLDHGFVRLVDKNGRDISIRMGRASTRAAELQPIFLAHLRDCGEMRTAARATPISVNTVRGWMRSNEGFRSEVESALAPWRGTRGERICGSCRVAKPIEEFSNRSDRPSQRTTCRSCKAKAGRESYARNKANAFFRHKATRARVRSKALGVACDIDAAYLERIWTGVCPVLGAALDPTTPRDQEESPELDRLIPDRGYVKGNVAWMSRRANRIKNNVSIAEMKLLIDWMEKTIGGNA